VFTREELLASGLDKSAITRRLKAGTLHRMCRNVYSIAPPALLRPEARWLGAVLACGDDAVLSHCSAAVLWGLLENRWDFVDVTTPRRGRKGTEGIRLHRTRRLEADEIAIVRAIPVTTVERTLLDLADVVPLRILRRAARQAEVLRFAGGITEGEAARRARSSRPRCPVPSAGGAAPHKERARVVLPSAVQAVRHSAT
jgi:hypothetical protein